MFEILPESKGNLLAIKASGKLTANDYEQVLLPKLEHLFKQHKRLKMLVEFSDDFAGWASTAAAWDDMKIGLQHGGDFESFAIVGGPEWVGWSAKLFGMFVRGEIRLFAKGGGDEALSWLNEESES